MALDIDVDGTISLYQGDTGEIVVNGLDIDKNYVVYLEFQDKNRNVVGGKDFQKTSNQRPSVTFFLDAGFTNKLVVPKSASYETYYYGIKVCELGAYTEDTIFIANKSYGEVNRVIVYPKQVEGTPNG